MSIRLSSASKPCVGCFGLPTAAGMPGVFILARQPRVSSSGSLVMRLSVRHSLRQNSGIVHRVLLWRCRRTTSKPLRPVCVVRGCGRKSAVNSVRSATVGMACRYRKTCWSRTSAPAVRTRSGQAASRIFARTKAGCIWRWSLTCGHAP